MHTEILTPAQLAVLSRLKGSAVASPFYLAGGTALALRHGHRRSIDFDFFRPGPFDQRALLSSLSARFEALELLTSGTDTLYVRVDGVTLSCFRLRYPLLEPEEASPWGFGIAGDRDLAAMKLEAVAARGSRKDFVDLHLLCHAGLTLEDVFVAFEAKYGTVLADRYHRLRALAYFDDAEREPVPDMLVHHDWEAVTRFFQAEAGRLLAAGLAG